MAQRMNKRQGKAKQADLGLQYTCTALYIRVSTQLQADEGFSLEAQQGRLEAFCTAQGWHVCPDHIYIDAGVSGKTTDRPQFNAMLEAAQAGSIKRIVAMKLDRMARNVREFLATVDQLKAWGCDLVLVKESFDTSTPHGRFALTMFAAMAELEASTITERVMSGKQQKASKGGYNGSRCPFGYTYSGGEFKKHDSQAAVVRDIFDGFINGESMSALADCLNVNETPTASGGKWYASTIRYILTNGIYAGVAQWHADGKDDKSKIQIDQVTKKDNDGKEVTATPYPAIIDKAIYEAAHKRLKALRPGIQMESEIARRLQTA